MNTLFPRQFSLTALLLLIGFSAIESTVVAQQTRDLDPLMGNYTLGGSSEIVVTWLDGKEVGQKIYDYTGIPTLESISKEDSLFSIGQLAEAFGLVDVATGDFNEDTFDDVARAWISDAANLELSINTIDGPSLTWSEAHPVTVSLQGGGVHPAYPNLRLVRGYFDDDPAPELALAYRSADNAIQLILFDTDGTLTAAATATASWTSAFSSLQEWQSWFDITAADLDGNGDDELVLTMVEPNAAASGQWGVLAQVYEVHSTEDNDTIEARSNGAIYLHADGLESPFVPAGDNNFQLNRLVLTAGDFNGDVLDELAIGFQIVQPSDAVDGWNLILPFRVMDDTLATPDVIDPFEKFDVDPDRVRVHDSNLGSDRGYPFSLTTGDLDGDGRDEILAAARTLVKVYSDSTESLTLHTFGQFNYRGEPEDRNHRTIAIADLNAAEVEDEEGGWHREIIVVETDDVDPQLLKIRVVAPVFDNFGNVTFYFVAEMRDLRRDSEFPRPFVVSSGDFDNDRVRVGPPRRLPRITEIRKPIVVLNAPPVHFDILNDQVFDVNECFDPNPLCRFVSRYSKTEQNTFTVSTTLTKDWGISTGAKASGGLFGVNLSASLSRTYGEGFSKQKTAAQTFTVSVERTAIDDDQLYAIVADYDVWEYPVYSFGELQGHVAVVIPFKTNNAWFPSKSVSANTYVPSHEVGNILSYPQLTGPQDNPSVAQSLRWETGDETTLSDISGGGSTWTLSQESIGLDLREHRTTMALSGSAGFEAFGIGASVDGNYETTEISTHSTTVSESVSISVEYGTVDASLGRTQYRVTPYAYWAKNGALVVDYAVIPDEDNGGGSTFWEDMYGSSTDLAFILPWRWDPEKNRAGTEEIRNRTKEILFDPPRIEAGQEVTISTRVHNFSLLDVTEPVKVRFYLGDPANGGTPVNGTDGSSEVSTDEVLRRQGSATVSLAWTVPQTIQTTDRIYAVIDPEDEYVEVHESNNFGWVQVNSVPVITNVDPAGDRRTETSVLHQNYPNPINGLGQIAYTLTEPAYVTLFLFDVLGRKVRVLEDGQKASGLHKVELDGRDLPAGVYFYSLRTGGLIETKQLVIAH